MATITFIEANGKEHELDASDGCTLMDVAVDNLIPGILGECGGACICATCHVTIDQEWDSSLPAMKITEQGILEGAMDVTPRSRLACQITVDESMDGMTVHIPESQI